MMKMMNEARVHKSPAIEAFLKRMNPERLEKTAKRMLIAAKIDDALKAKGWSKKDFSEKMCKRPSEITKWLSGTHNFTIDTIVSIETTLNIQLIDVSELISA